MARKKNIGGVIPLTPTERELISWNILFRDYLWLDPIRDKGQEPGRICYCTRCRKTYRVNEWARIQTIEERDILTVTHAHKVKCAKCGTICEARFTNVSRRKTGEGNYVAVIRANGKDEVLIDGYLLWKEYGEAKDGYTAQFVALPKWRKCERYVLRPGEATKYILRNSWSRSNENDDDPKNWCVDSFGDNILDMFLSYKGCMAQRYEPYHLYGDYNLSGTFLRYNALKEWNRATRDRKTVRYLSLLCLYPGLETLIKAGYTDIVKAVVFEKLKFYGRIDLMGKDPQGILGISRAECVRLRNAKSDQQLVLKAHKHHCKNKEWSVTDICALRDACDYVYTLNDMLCFCDAKGTSPRALLKYLLRQHEQRLRQYDEAMRENGCMARHGGIAPCLHDEWMHLRDWHNMYVIEMGIVPREIYPKDVSEAHDAIINMRNERVEREIAADRERRGLAMEQLLTAERNRWKKQTELKYEEAAEIDGDVSKCELMDKRLRWRIKHLSFAKGNYMVVIPQRTRELVAEGEALHHCVGTYLSRYALSKTNIVFIRHKEHLEQHLLTVEIDNEGRVIQCYGFDDDREFNKGKAWMKPERDKYLAIYNKDVRTFAEHYKAHLAEHFEELKNKNNKKVRTTA